MKRAAVYARISTDDGRQNLESQLGVVRDHAKRAGLEITKEYLDQTSGTTTKRPGLDALLKDAHGRRFDLVLVFKLDRLGRSVAHLVRVLDELRALGIGFASASEAIDTSTPTGALMLNLLAAFAQFEREVIIERTVSGLARARREGKKLGRPAVDVPEDRLRSLHASGMGLRAMARALHVAPGTVKKTLARLGLVSVGELQAESTVQESTV
jgi:DNA invertase Pin-like site-specific DNA recombinase